MKDLTLSRYALSAFAGIAMLAGCGSQTQVPAVQSTQSQSAEQHRATPACGGSRIGQAQCDVLIETGAAHAMVAGWSASDLEAAYDLPSSTKGTGQIVAIVDAYDNPNVASDLAEYRSTMGLSTANFYKYNQDGEQSGYPQGSEGWGVEIDLDVEMASASCPNCTIYLVEATSNAWTDLEAAEKEAVKLGATIVSNSYSGSGASESYYDTKGITYLASSGDGGLGIYDPAAFDSVAAVGGTVLSLSSHKRGYREKLWSDSGGGCSYEPKPRWQHDKTCAGRLANDVSAVAVDVAEYDSYGYTGWLTIDGTSIGSPLLGGVFGLAGNSTHQNGGRTFWQNAHHKYLYRVASTRYTEQGGWGSPKGVGAF